MTDNHEHAPLDPGQLFFLKGAENVLGSKAGKSETWEQSAARVRESLSDALSARHVAFLLGSGCSSYVRAGKQFGIPTMAPLAKTFTSQVGTKEDTHLADQAERDVLQKAFGIDLASPDYTNNLETLLEVLFSLHFALRRTQDASLKAYLAQVESVITKATRFILKSCTEGPFAQGDESVVELYQTFHRKLAYRDRALPRPWIFTTNYDVFNETAMDRLAIPYSNGFSGTVERRFNPANFRYSLGEQLDISSRKWTAAESFVYLCKLHGSINWVADNKGLFPIRELQQPPANAGRLMIYPTPAKQAASFGSPYADLFREFQSRVVREQSVLVALGYSFSDEHVNNIIFQALTVPSFRLIAFVSAPKTGVPAQLRSLGDPRVWIVGGTGPSPERKAHYFDSFVEHFMPDAPADNIDKAVSKVVDTLLNKAMSNDEKDENGGG